MAPETDYYQIGGFRAHSERWFKMYDGNPLIDAIANDTGRELRPGGRGAPIELVLGILPNGASYVLMTSQQMWAFVRKHGLRRPRTPWKADNFVSLSPIYFTSKIDLQEKLKTYRIKAQKNKQDKEDNSQANRGFVRVRGHSQNPRGNFENQRVLYRLVTKSVTPGALGLLNPPWADAVRVISLVMNTWNNDRRPERFEKPNIIDVGWTDVMLSEYLDSGRATETAHLKMKGTLQNEKSDAPFKHGITEEGVVADTLYARMRTLFTHDAAKSGIPLVVLVHEEEMVRGVLIRSGIDVGSFTSVGTLLRSSQPQTSSRQMSSRSASPRRPDASSSYSSRDYDRRSKHEPDDDVKPFSVKQEDYHLPSVGIGKEDKKPDSSHQDGDIPPPATCIVNMQILVKTLMRTDQTGPTVPATALRLNIPTNPRLPCAGNECHLLLQMWISMAEGRPIDEQWMDRLAHPIEPPSPTIAPVQVDAEEDIDPNDYLPPAVTNPGGMAAHEDEWSDDDW